MTRNSPRLIQWGIVFTTILLCLAAGIAFVQSLDPNRVEKWLVQTVRPGDGQPFVMAQVKRLGLSSVVLKNNGKSFSQQSAFAGSGINPSTVSLFVAAKGQEGYPMSDLYRAEVFFFFDRSGRLIKYRVQKVWIGL